MLERAMKPSSNKHNKWDDHYARKAKHEQFPARSVYKLQEIQKKYNLIKKGYSVLDLGCFPGSWLLYAAQLVGETGWVTGLDLKTITIKLPEHVHVITGDVFDFLEINPIKDKIGKQFHVVLSDMAPATTSSKTVDSARSFILCQTALSVAKKNLIAGGSFVCKIFQGEDFQAFISEVRTCFQQQKIFKPKSSRKTSKEIYIIGMGKK